ncbi:MAG: TAT-variant-translocated molybdopterin oxidoreductase [Sinobacteraceae bacterium]|nr:TAT-variant-translocated molybdopterin oxidoreductase [Nevskiaceae bacterium]
MSSLNRPWRSIAEWEADPGFLARAGQEFPHLAEALANPHSRRQVLKLMAAAFAMAGIAGCDAGAPGGRLIPAVKSTPGIVPGLPNYYSTAHVIDGFASGIIVAHQMGRPIKVEGNPLHPASLGATDAIAQAQVLEFYDPDRAAALAHRRRPSDRQAFLTAWTSQRQRLTQTGGAGLRILTGTITSPTLAAQLEAVLSKYSQARWHQWEPISRDNVRKGSQLAFGQLLDLAPNLAAVDVLLAVDSDLLGSAPGHLRFARDLMSRRNPSRTAQMNRIYAIEPTPTLIGSVADHRFIAGPEEMMWLLSGLAARILRAESVPGLPPWLVRVSDDLTAHKGRALVHIGPDQPASAHALVHAINDSLGARGTTLDLIEPVAHAATADQGASLRELVNDMRGGHVEMLLVIDSNPVFAAPGALGFAEALARVPFSVDLSLHQDETFDATTWSVPMAHAWEGWADARAYDGTATVLQPQAMPLYEGVSAHQILGLFDASAGAEPFGDTLSAVQATWRSRFGDNFADRWRDSLATGVVADTAAGKLNPTLRAEVARQVLSPGAPPAGAASGSTEAARSADGAWSAQRVRSADRTRSRSAEDPLTLLFRPDPHIWDGRYANNPWLQELPRPLTKLTWDNPLLIAPALAYRLGLANGDEVRLTVGDARVLAPVWILPGQHPGSLVALLGFGRRAGGAIAQGSGVDYYPLLGQTGSPMLEKTGRRLSLASTDHHNLILNAANDLIKHGTLADYQRDPHFLNGEKPNAELYRWHPPGPAAWAMSIDLNTCIGCSACVVACQSENNVPVVGKEQVIHEREMHWLRIDRYWDGTPEAPRTFFQPVLCMQCEQAPCEVVCPVGATVHDSEGLNVMVYNRCVGTRFCSNNCPYKVRRFNYFAYTKEEHRAAESRNPDVSVRGRGVMEKCTFCLQRIAEARIAADRESRPVGTVTTACQAACPTQAITFGNLRDPASEVVRRKRSPLDYALLEEQNTHPRVTYEARIENPNLSLASNEGHESSGG